MTYDVASSYPPELLSGPCGCPRNHELPTPKSKVEGREKGGSSGDGVPGLRRSPSRADDDENMDDGDDVLEHCSFYVPALCDVTRCVNLVTSQTKSYR